MDDITKLIVGAWRLVHSVSINSDGKKEYPYGEDAIGYISYSDTGIIAKGADGLTLGIRNSAANGTGLQRHLRPVIRTACAVAAASFR